MNEKIIYEIISTLNKGEKKSFFLYLKQQDNSGNLPELWKLINKKNLSFEKINRKDYSLKQYKDTLAKLKEHLQKWLLITEKANEELIRKRELLVAEILIRRGAFASAYSIIKKIKKFFTGHLDYVSLFTVIKMEISLIYNGFLKEDMKEKMREMEEVLLQQELLSYFNKTEFQIVEKAYGFFDSLGNDKAVVVEMEKLICNYTFDNNLKKANPIALGTGYGTLALLYLCKSDTQKALFYQKKSLDIFSSLSHIKRLASTYWSTVNNYLLFLNLSGEYETLLKEIKKFQKENFFGIHKEIAKNSLFSYETEAYALSEKKEKIAEKETQILASLKEKDLHFEYKSADLLALAKFYYLEERFSETKKILEKMMELTPKNYVKHIYARIGYLLVLLKFHKQEEDSSYYHYLIKNQIRWLERHHLKFQAGKILLGVLDKIIDGKKINKKRLVNSLQKIEKENLFERHFIRYFNLYDFLEEAESLHGRIRNTAKF